MKKYILGMILFAFASSSYAGVDTKTTSSWGNGYCMDLVVENTTGNSVTNWEINFDLDNKSNIYTFWSGNFLNNNGKVKITPVDWNQKLYDKEKTTIGFCVENTTNKPKNVKINFKNEDTTKNEDVVSPPKNNDKENKEEDKKDEVVKNTEFINDFTPPFIAKNGQLYDQNGKIVQLRGVNWFGLQSGIMVLGGLWEVNYKDMINQMKSLGFNAVRLPFCPLTLKGQETKDFSYINPEIAGLNSLEAMDFMINALTKEKMFVLLDMHNPDCKEISETPQIEGYSLDDWINDWKFVVNRYKNNKYVFGVDPKNEPHGDAVWNNSNDLELNWKAQVEKVGKEILKINPDLLIFVEGIEKNHPWGSDKLDCESSLSQSWGGNIGPIECYPINPNMIPKSNLVLSPHIYGPSVYPRDYFKVNNFPNNMKDVWEETFGKFAGDYTIIIGEMGGDYVGEDAIWQDALIDYLKSKNLINFFYWSWNANSTDTKGLVKDDWKTVETGKYNNLKRLFISNENDIIINNKDNNSSNNNSSNNNSSNNNSSNSNNDEENIDINFDEILDSIENNEEKLNFTNIKLKNKVFIDFQKKLKVIIEKKIKNTTNTYSNKGILLYNSMIQTLYDYENKKISQKETIKQLEKHVKDFKKDIING